MSVTEDLASLASWAASHESSVRRTGSWAAVIQFRPSDGEGPAYLEVDGGALRTSTGVHPHPTVTIEGTGEALGRAVRGELDITQVLARGLGTIEGDYFAALNLSRLALARRRAPAAA